MFLAQLFTVLLIRNAAEQDQQALRVKVKQLKVKVKQLESTNARQAEELMLLRSAASDVNP